MKQAQLPVYSLEAQKLLRDRQTVRNYLESLKKMQMLCLVPSNGINNG